MDALIMAAGYGERLKPLTDKTPKCLLPVINDSCLLDYWLSILQSCRLVDKIIINICHLKEKVIDHIESTNYPHMKEQIEYQSWDALPTTATAVLEASKRMVSGKLLLINADTYIPDPEAFAFIRDHSIVWENWPIMLGVTYSNDIRDQSYTLIDPSNNIIHQFQEKQSKIKEGYFWSGIALIDKIIIDDSFKGLDLSKDIFGAVKRRGTMKAYPIRNAIDIGRSLEEYRLIYENLTTKPRNHIERLGINDPRFKPGSTMFGGVRGDHIARYLFASKYAVDRRVMDIGCGTGYGLKIMSYMASELTGVDRSEEAKNAFWELDCSQQQCSVKFVVRDLNDPLWLPDEGGYDLITAFEIIEHFKNPDRIIQVAHDYLKSGSCFICSVPNETRPDMGMSIYHNHLFTLPQFRELLQKCFKPENITVYGQNQTHFSTIDVDNAGYFVAIARKD